MLHTNSFIKYIILDFSYETMGKLPIEKLD